MAQLDAATQLFIDKVAEDHTPSERDHTRDAFSIARKVVNLSNDPRKVITRAILGAATKELTKEGSAGVIKIYDTLNEHYQKTWWDWEPETIWKTLTVEHGIEADRELKDLIMALQTVVTTHLPLESWHVFEKVSCAFNQNDVDFRVIQPAEMDEIAFTVAVLKHIRGEVTPYDDDVLGYIASCAKLSGFVYLPSDLYPARAQEFLDRLNNNMELKNKVKAKKDDGTPAYQIQVRQLKEVAEYVLGQKRD